MTSTRKKTRRSVLGWFARASALTCLPTYAQTNHATSQPESFYPPAKPNTPLRFPRDHGAHWPFRTEWWYLTAWLETSDGPLGIQLTFFRSRTRHNPDNPSRFAPKQIVFGHAAIADPKHGTLRHTERAARAMPGMIGEADTALSMGRESDRWQLIRQANDTYIAQSINPEFEYLLELNPQGPPVAQGDDGYSRKGNRPTQASYYYSRPQLAVTGAVRLAGQDEQPVTGTGWLDHEWSSELLDAQAVGWDWAGLNLANGDALMLFRTRSKVGETVYSHARWIRGGRAVDTQPPRFAVERTWQSPRTGVVYPVQVTITVGAWQASLIPLIDDQEIDASLSTQTIYWEGAVRVVESKTQRALGKGYLELTGYSGKVRF